MLEKQLTVAKAECVDVGKSQVVIKSQLDSLSLEKMNKEEEFSLTKQKNQKEILNLTSSLTLAEDSLVELKAEFRLVEQKSQKEIMNLTSELSLAESSVTDMKAANETLEGIFEKQNTRITELSEELANGQEIRDSLEERASSSEGQVSALTKDVESFSSSIQKLKDDISSLQSSIETRDAELRTSGEELAANRVALIEEKRELAKFESLCGSSDSKIVLLQKSKNQLSEKIRELDVVVISFETELATASESNSDLTTRLYSQNLLIENLQLKKEDMDRENDRTLGMIEDCRVELRASKSMVCEHQATIDEMKTGNSEARNEMSEVQDKLTATELMLNVKESEVGQLASELGLARRKAEILGNENMILNGRAKELDGMSGKLETALKSEVMLERENIGFRNRLTKQVEMFEVANEKNFRLELEAEDLFEKIRMSDAEILELTENLSSCNDEVESLWHRLTSKSGDDKDVQV